MKYLLFLFLLLAGNYTAFAALGDTKEQIQNKYGVPSKSTQTNKSILFNSYGWNGCFVDVIFIDGKSECERYRKLSGGEFSNDEIQTMLGANTLGSKWLELPLNDVNEKEWERAYGYDFTRMTGTHKAWKLESGVAFATVIATAETVETAKYRTSIMKLIKDKEANSKPHY